MGDLPEGWAIADLEDIALINPRHSTSLDSSLKISFVPMPGVSDRSRKFNFTETRLLREVRNGFTHFAEADVLVAKITPSMENGKVRWHII